VEFRSEFLFINKVVQTFEVFYYTKYRPRPDLLRQSRA